jgi:hypothetical protein
LACRTFASTGTQNPGAAARRKKAGQSQKRWPFFGISGLTRFCRIKRNPAQQQSYDSSHPGSGRSLTQPVERLRWRDRRDSNPHSNDVKSQLEKGVPPFTKEQWTQIWTHFSGEDRRMLSQIVEKWGSLSDELKRAVLRVVGSGR